MNKGLFKLIFNKRTGQLTPTWEGAPAQGKSSATSRAAALLLTLMMFAEPVLANPSGGTVVNGTVGFNQSGNTLTITNSPNSIINWQSFSINSGEVTRFMQETAASAVLNRVTGLDPSQILGTLQSNGRVFVINPNGIVFGQGSVVDVAGLVASTLRMSDADFMNGALNFTDGVGARSIQNQGSITTPTGGQVYLIAPNIENSGVITSPRGEIVLAAGHTVSLVDPRNPSIVVDITAPATQAINMGQMIAEGGGAGIFAALVNQSGIVSANSASVDASGQVTLRGTQSVTLAAGSMTSADNSAGVAGNVSVYSEGTTTVNGSITARGATQGGNVETTGPQVKIGDTARVDTRADNGSNGTWDIAQNNGDFSIEAVNGSISGATLSTNLGTSNIAITSGLGAINVNDNVSWNTNNLNLTAAGDVNINAVMTATGNASLTLNPATTFQDVITFGKLRVGFNPNGTFKGRIDYSASGPLTINGNEYIVVNNFTDLQTTGENLAGFYALGSNIEGGVFTPLGDFEIPFTGVLEGLGHTINNLVIDQPGLSDVGLYGYAQYAEIRNVGLVNATVRGGSEIGALVGSTYFVDISNSFATGTVSAGDNVSYIGGLVGFAEFGTIENSRAAVNVMVGNTASNVGGLAGFSNGQITGSSATGAVMVGNNVTNVGGLVGLNNEGIIQGSHATGNVSAGDFADTIGGLVGANASGEGGAQIYTSYATGDVAVGSESYRVGGFVGENRFSSIDTSYSTGSVTTTGLAGFVGGFAGANVFGTISDSFSTGSISIAASDVDHNYFGGFVGENGGSIYTSYSIGYVQAPGAPNAGGFAGSNVSRSIFNSYWNTESSGLATSAGGVGLTTAQMMSGANFAGFDFGNVESQGIWAINEGTSLPYLRDLFANGIQAFSGVVDGYAPRGALQKADLSIGGDVFGVGATSLSKVSVGANGFIYHFLDRNVASIANGTRYQVNLVSSDQMERATFVGNSLGANMDAVNLNTTVNGLTNNATLAFSNMEFTQDVNNLGTLDLSGVNNFRGRLDNDGTLNNDGTIDTIRYSIDGFGVINNRGTFNVYFDEGPRYISPTFNNTGTLNLMNSASGYTFTLNDFRSNDGTLRVGQGAVLALLNDFTNNGVLSGKGTVDLDYDGFGVLFNNGTISPGASPGVLTINGDLVLNPSSTLLIELAGTTPGLLFDVLNVNGTATLNGAVNVVQFDPNFGSAVGDTFRFLNVLNTQSSRPAITGSFANVISPTAFTVALSQSANAVDLNTIAVRIVNPPVVDPSVFIDPSGVPNTGSATGADNNAGTNPSNPSVTTFNALLEGAPTAAIGGNGDGGSGEVISELYLGEPIIGANLDARLLCR